MKGFIKILLLLGLLAVTTRTVAQETEEAKLTSDSEKVAASSNLTPDNALAGAPQNEVAATEKVTDEKGSGEEAAEPDEDKKDDGEATNNEDEQKGDDDAKDHADEQKDDKKQGNDEHSSQKLSFIECDCRKKRVRGTGAPCSCADLVKEAFRHSLLPWFLPGFFPRQESEGSTMKPRLSGRQRLLGLGNLFGGYYPGYGYGYPGYGYGYGYGYPGYGYPGYGFGGFGPGFGVGFTF
ncbi:hypothetical protein TGPRC2_319890 [Toxoplasma gondii TgCatPRC2]|uniref:Uncharacterized protein n=5 Tax=Toxoplasma gondii TaxID=5811 RepID=S7VSZ0_TOXGG|nr:hypothetical protein TGME49_319890 [Toxoplasma gondii ME49]EPR58159.1 hypothetical protein TGGT1_319890 [Toxoplasma gondii GT1]KAF4644915.1 hypothetical protein TGRH88_007300 [Toxoplasma gondii]KYK66830.1 hypothetical protein TGPRC2_319890 [Toxoplasma gondii TgCatPRC2]PIL97426.1 hypothetical protein TGCOUG_319890 [Toxoplasma gondii COUG]EPT31531.1 hypothetical protein TGME49_319890 [Toxoplasma gondii ME49]|eukprot:XP_002369856.1 hypothetical protein TGME49_319890 [Toxoplasma gondii ME49]